MDAKAQSVRCPICRGQVLVETRDAHGDQVQCDNCNNAFRVTRRDTAVRLVVADVGPFRDELKTVLQRVETLERELAAARASLGIGINGFLLGLLYVVVKIAWEKAPLTQEIVVTAVAISLACALLLEMANYLFLAKRQSMSRLSEEIAEEQLHVRKLRQTIRNAQRAR